MPENLQAGDIIIQLDKDTADHTLMWVGGEKPIVHSSEGENFSGVIQQSAGPLLNLKDDSKPWKGYARVFRSDDGLGPLAATFAIKWAVRSDNVAYIEARKLYDEQDRAQAEEYANKNPRGKRTIGAPQNITIGNAKTKSLSVALDTPFSQARLEKGDKEWDVHSLFRALRAYDRGKKGLPLSQLKGITCSQFATYCYQAASLDKQLGGAPIPSNILNHIANSGAFYSLKQGTPDQANIIKHALEGYPTDCIPKAMLVDAKTTSAGNLMAKLLQEGSRFSDRGFLAPTPSKKLVVITSQESQSIPTYHALGAYLSKSPWLL
jgi:hypothetical protein